MGFGAYISITNRYGSDVTVSVPHSFNMDNGGHPKSLKGTLANGATSPSSAPLYIESSGLRTSRFHIIFTDTNTDTEIGSLIFTEEFDSYTLLENTNPSRLIVTFFNPNPASNLNQAYIGITVSPFNLNWTTWMTNLPGLGNLQLNQICIPGTHDSGTYSIAPLTDDGGIATWLSTIINMNLVTQLIINEVFNAIVTTQSFSIGQVEDFNSQLIYGARYFDIRPGGTLSNTSLFDNQLFHVHSPNSSTVIACAPLSEIIQSIQAFAQQYPQEIIFLNFSHLTTSATNNFTFTNPYTNVQDGGSAQYSLKFLALSQIYDSLCNLMLPSSLSPTTTLNDVWQNNPNKNIVAFVDCTDDITLGSGEGQINIAAVNGNPGGAAVFQQITNTNQIIGQLGNYANSDTLDGLLGWLPKNILPQTELYSMLQTQMTAQPSDIYADIESAIALSRLPYNNLNCASFSNQAVQAQYNINLQPASSSAQLFASNVNFFIVDGFDGTPTNWAVTSNLYKLGQL